MNHIININDFKLDHLSPNYRRDSEHLHFMKLNLDQNAQIDGIFVTSHTGFIEWKDNPEMWAGPYFEKYTLCRISDHTMSTELDTKDTVLAKWRKYLTYSRDSFSNRILNEINFNPVLEVNGNRYSRSELTHKEYLLAMSLMTEEDEFEEYNKKIDRHYPELQNILCKETPVKIYLSGNDDTSYTKCVDTIETAEHIIKSIVEDNGWWKVIDTEFSFTN